MHLPFAAVSVSRTPNLSTYARVRLKNLGTTDKKSSRKIKYKKDSESTYVKTGGGIKMRKLDMAWINGNIYTADDKFSTVAAFGVSGDRFSVVGSTEEVLENCDEHTKIIDLQGKTVLLD